MDVIDLCDSDDDETDTPETQNQRLDSHQSFQSTPPSNTTTSRAATVTQRPRSISSLSNSSAQVNGDTAYMSNDHIGTRQEQHSNSRGQHASDRMENSMVKPKTAREKSWAMFQQIRRDLQLRRGPSKEETKVSAPAASAAPKKSPPAPVPPQEKRKRKRSNSSLNRQIKSASSSTMAKKPAATKAKRNDTAAPRKNPSFLEQGLENGTNTQTDQQQSPPLGQYTKNSLDLFSSLGLFQAVEVYDEIIPNDEENQDDEVAVLQTTAEPHASSGATLQAAIEIDSDVDDDDDANDIMEVQYQENGTTPEAASEQDLGHTQQQESASLAARATENFHPLLQLDSTHTAGERHPNRDKQDFSRRQDSMFVHQESESVVHILDHRFKAGKVIFEVEDCYGTVHRGILLEDLKVDAPALLSNYILGKSRGKLSGKDFRQWAIKTKKELDRNTKKYMAKQKRRAHQKAGPSEGRGVVNLPARSMAQSSHVPIDIDDDEGEFEFDSSSSPAPTRPPDYVTRHSTAAPLATQSDELHDKTKYNDHGNEPSISEVEIRTTTEIESQGDCVPARSSSSSLEPEPDNKHGDQESDRMMKDSHPLDDTMDTGNKSENLSSIDDGPGGSHETGETDMSENLQVPLQTDAARSVVPDLNEEFLKEQREDVIKETEPRTPDSAPVGARPAYTVAEVAMEMEEEYDDEIEVIEVKSPARKKGHCSSQSQSQKKGLAEQTTEDVEDSSDDSVQSASPASSNVNLQPLMGSIETPIDIDGNESNTMTTDDMDRTISTTGEKKEASEPLVGSIETPIDIDNNDNSTMANDEVGRSFSIMGEKKKALAPPTSYFYSERRFVFHRTQPKRPPPSARRPTASTWSYGISCDAAMKEQERLFQASAAKMRSHRTAQVAKTVPRNATIKFQQVVPNIAEKYPLHWQFSDYSARLGVPEGSSESVIKKQYRRLALLYHPDKSQLANTATKFQNITEAYRTLLNR